MYIFSYMKQITLLVYTMDREKVLKVHVVSNKTDP